MIKRTKPLHIPLKKIKLNTKKAPDPLQCQMLFIISAEALFFNSLLFEDKVAVIICSKGFLPFDIHLHFILYSFQVYTSIYFYIQF